MDSLPSYKDLGIYLREYSFDCPVGEWRARLDAKAWGKQRNILLYFTQVGTGRKYCVSLYQLSYYVPEDAQFDFRRAGKPGERFALETAKRRTGTTRLLSARIIPASEQEEPAVTATPATLTPVS
jgi:hypothetical protein